MGGTIMANQIRNRLTVVGLKENPQDFAKALEIAMYGIAVPHEPGNLFVEVRDGCFDYITKWGPKDGALIEVSQKREDHVFLLSYGGFESQRNGQVVIRNGDVLESFDRTGYCGLFDEIEYPTVNLFEPYLKPLTLAQRAENRLEDAIRIVRRLIEVMEDARFTNSPSRPYSDCRDKEKTEKLQAGLTALHESLVEQAKQLDFKVVFLEEQELAERYQAVVEADKTLMQGLGLEPLLSAPGEAARFSILPFQVALTKDPRRVILPVLHYVNADPVSGKYQKGADGSVPPIAWELRYLCLSPSDVRYIKSLPDDDQTPLDIDIVVKHADDRAFGRELYRASNRARWRANPELVKEVEREAITMSDAFAAKVADQTGISIFADFRAVDEALFPKTVK
jgi:hypothetical protein